MQSINEIFKNPLWNKILEKSESLQSGNKESVLLNEKSIDINKVLDNSHELMTHPENLNKKEIKQLKKGLIEMKALFNNQGKIELKIIKEINNCEDVLKAKKSNLESFSLSRLTKKMENIEESDIISICESMEDLLLEEYKMDEMILLFKDDQAASNKLVSKKNQFSNAIDILNKKNNKFSIIYKPLSLIRSKHSTGEEIKGKYIKELKNLILDGVPENSYLKNVFKFAKKQFTDCISSTLCKNISNLMEFNITTYKQVFFSRFDHLIDSKRAVPGDNDKKRKMEFFIKRHSNYISTNVSKYKEISLDIIKKDSQIYSEWIDKRMNLSGTASGVSTEVIEDDVKDAAIRNWKQVNMEIALFAAEGKELDFDTICYFHKILAADQPNNDGVPGELRTMDIYSGPKWYLPGDLVKEAVDEYLKWFKTEMDNLTSDEPIKVVEFSALAYQRFLSIHPFSDGNGRISRFIMDYVLQKFELPPCMLSTETVSVAVFTNIEDEKNIHPLECIQNVMKGMQTSLEFVIEESNKIESNEKK